MSNPFLSIDKEILADSGTSGAVEENLLCLCDEIGSRFAGTAAYRRAADYMLGRFHAYKLDNARLEPFDFTAWRRGDPAQLTTEPESEAEVKAFECYELPYSASSGRDGIAAELVDIGGGSPEEIEGKRAMIPGRMVLTTSAAGHRKDTYARCVELGATAFILHSNRKGMILSTGSVTDAEQGAMPAIGTTYECGLQIQRLIANNKHRQFRLVTQGTLEPATTWNVVGELTGTEFPDELVIIGGHLDSHDIGPGAFDNAAGAVLVMETARLLAKQRKNLRRTVRFIGFAAEEIGLLGSHHHAEKHAAELQKARFMLNCDTPALGRPHGLGFHKCPKADDYLKKIAAQMQTPLICQNRAHCHSDHYPFILQGLPTAGVAGGRFGPGIEQFVHMAADTPDKISLTDLRDAAAFAARFLVRAANDDQWPDMRRSEEEINDWCSK